MGENYEPFAQPVGRSSTPPLLRASDRDGFIAWVQIEAEDHQLEEQGGGCTCGFCAWSVEHVIIMAIREVWDFRGWPQPADDASQRAPRPGARPLSNRLIDAREDESDDACGAAR